MKDLSEYFDKLALQGIDLTDGQKRWYSKKFELLHEDVLREYPSTPEEAFMASQEGYWYTTQLRELYASGRVTKISYDRAIPVLTAWDLGQADFSSIFFYQIPPSGEIKIIDYWEATDTPIDQIAQILTAKGYTYGSHIWPSDARARGRGGITFEQQARGVNLQGIVLEQHGLLDGINLVRTKLSQMWFDQEKCKVALEHLEKYKKKWNNVMGGFTSEPLHDEHSHCCDALRYLVAGLDKVGKGASLKDHYKALNSYMGY